MMMMMNDAVIKGTLALKLAQLMAELFRGNCAIINEITTEQLDAFVAQLTTTKVMFHSDNKHTTFSTVESSELLLLFKSIARVSFSAYAVATLSVRQNT